MTFQKIAIINRGEPAMRLIRAVKDWNASHALPLKTVALYTDVDRNSPFVYEADQSIKLGNALSFGPGDANPRSLYLDYESIVRALKATGADAAWPGWGFVAEHPEFAERCRDLGITFIGPPPEAMRRLGDKIGSKLLAESVHVPVAPWSGGAVEDIEEALHKAKSIGFPLLVKATAGGGGRGIRFVDGPEDLPQAFRSASEEAKKAFGDGTVFLESRIGAARHVEVQIIADDHGQVWAAGVRDCTAQRCNQKVIEEAPCPILTEEQDQFLRQAAIRLAKAADYRNAGTAEFLFEPATGNVYFMEMNARLQVEHPVTEATSEIDLVGLQIAVALGEPLPTPHPPTPRGHAIEVRLCAEDPDRSFAPAPGRMLALRTPYGPGVRTDIGLREGDRIPVEFDSMIAKIIATGATREEARSRLLRALHESVAVVEGGVTNRCFLIRLLEHEDFKQSQIDTAWIDRLMRTQVGTVKRFSGEALATVAILLYEARMKDEEVSFFASADKGRALVSKSQEGSIDICFEGTNYSLRVSTLGSRLFRIAWNDQNKDQSIDLRLRAIGNHEVRVTDATGRNWKAIFNQAGQEWLLEIDGELHRLSNDAGGFLRAPSPGLVLSCFVEEGAVVQAGDRLVSLEAMKMEFPVTAPFPGVVRKVLVSANDQVEAGSPLLVLDPSNSKAQSDEPVRDVDAKHHPLEKLLPTTAVEPNPVDELRRLLLGFELSEAKTSQHLQRIQESDAFSTDDLVTLLAGYWDVEALFSKVIPPSLSGQPRLSQNACFQLYLGEFKEEGQGLPKAFLTALKRTLVHYGIQDFADSIQLRQVLLRIHLAHQNAALRSRVALSISQKLLKLGPSLDSRLLTKLRPILDRACNLAPSETKELGEIARQLKYSLFEGRDHARRQEAHLRRAEEILESFQEDLPREEITTLLTELRSIPCSLSGLISANLTPGKDPRNAFLLELLLRRQHLLPNDLKFRRMRQNTLVFDIQVNSEPITIVAACCALEELDQTLTRLATDIQNPAATYGQALEPGSEPYPGPSGDTRKIQCEIYVPLQKGTEAETLLEACRHALKERPAASEFSTLCVSGLVPMEGLLCHTWQQTEGRWEELTVLQDIHPALAQRLELWRLKIFDLQLISHHDNILLFQARGKTNPKDERLFAFAEVLDLTQVRDSEGNLTELPELEHLLLDIFQHMRDIQSRRPAKNKLVWNRITLYIRPMLQADRSAMLKIGQRLNPHAQGLGLEKVSLQTHLQESPDESPKNQVITLADRTGNHLEISLASPHHEPLRPLDDYTIKVVRARQKNMTYVYELLHLMMPKEASNGLFPGEFQEFDLEDEQAGYCLVPVARPFGQNSANVVIGIIRNQTPKHPEGMARVIVLGDGTREMGALAEPECRRIIGAIDLAERLGLPLEWFPISSGAKIAMDSGTENLDWTAAVLGRIIHFTQGGGEINIVVDGINVGAQSYWNAEATMLMHTKGCLIMTPKGTMMLTGKKALDFSGSVSAEDNIGIGGYERIMGPNGQAHYFAKNLQDACCLLFRYYEHAYISPGEGQVRPKPTSDLPERAIVSAPMHDGGEMEYIGDIWNDEKNPGRKRPFDIRTIMGILADQDSAPLERWAGMRNASGAVVWDAHLGGHAVSLIGIESKPLLRKGYVPGDGPSQWTGGTLFPLSSKKVARAINAVSGRRPLVVLANLSGFDGSPESLRHLQLEYGAEIGRAVANFKGPIIFCIISRYHGGAYVVFSKHLNPSMRVMAISGAYASVIGGAPAAAVVFTDEVRSRTLQDPRLEKLVHTLKKQGIRKPQRSQEYQECYAKLHAEKVRELAESFDSIHTVQRAQAVGSLDCIIEPQALREEIIATLAGHSKSAPEAHAMV